MPSSSAREFRLTAAIANITFACEEPVRLAKFWAAALGYVPLEVPQQVQEAVVQAIEAGELDPEGWAMLVLPTGSAPASTSAGSGRRRPSRFPSTSI